MIPRLRVLLLAAGGSRRFGGPKLLARVEGESLLRRAARVALGCRSAGCTVVLGAGAIRLQRELRGLAVDIVVNRAWRTGLSSSLRAGIAAMPASTPGALVLLADQVCVGPADLELLIAAWQRDSRTIVAARAGAVLGPPVILPRSVFRAVHRLRGDTGAKALLSDPDRTVVEVGITSAGFDVDTPADLARWRKDSVLS
ncbi:MAG: nucleotidyltransferase family protein [Steroidobacteraceae bacterium]